MRRADRAALALAAALCTAPVTPTAAQAPNRSPGPGVSAGGDREEYLRTLQLLGTIPVHQWSIRAHGPRELARFVVADTARLAAALPGEWCGASCGVAHRGWASAGLLPIEAAGWYNSTHPFGMNDGVVWAGRGLTVASTVGAFATVGPVSVVLSPVFFRAQNQGFPLEPNGQSGRLRFADQFNPTAIDHPQRFGEGTYSRADFGESTIRLDLPGLTAGASTAAQWWGPMTTYPYVLGNNAGGFKHVFLGTSAPVNVGVGSVHVRVIYGSPEQSAYSFVPADSGRRFASGIVAVFEPRGLAGLEVGGARFFMQLWPDAGIGSAELRKPFDGLLKRSRSGELREDVHNQLASVFARLVLPASGVEAYGEFGREDHNADLRDLWLEPDHISTYGLGLRRAWRSDTTTTSVVTVELVNTRTSHLARVRPQIAPYQHWLVHQGHTQRGQPLALGFGARSGDALVFSLRRVGSSGDWIYSLSRQGEAADAEGAPRLVRFTGAAGRAIYRGPLEIDGSVSVTHRVGRREARGATNLGVTLRTRWAPVAPGW